MRPAALSVLFCAAVVGLTRTTPSPRAVRLAALDSQREITQYVQTAWSADSGLPQASVHAITQTKDGYLWIATEQGIARFDGVHFTAFSRRNTKEFPSDYVRALLASRDGSLWIGTDSGIVHRISDKFQTYAMKDGLSNANVWALAESSDGSVWVGTEAGLNRIRNGRVLRAYGPSDGLPGPKVRVIRHDQKGALWVGTDGGLACLDPSTGHIASFTKRNGLPANSITSLAVTTSGSIWIGSYDGKLAYIDAGRISTFAQRLPASDITALLADRDGNLWIGFEQHRMARLTGDSINRASKTAFRRPVARSRRIAWRRTAECIL
jgi:ligand-binding sensor domain-containing protein